MAHGLARSLDSGQHGCRLAHHGSDTCSHPSTPNYITGLPPSQSSGRTSQFLGCAQQSPVCDREPPQDAMKSYVVNRILWLQVITVALLLAAFAAFGLYAAAKHDAAQKRLDQAEPRYARLMGLMARREDIGSFSVQANESISRMAYPSSQDATQTGNEAQQRLRSIFAESKLDIGSIQVLPVKEGPHFDRIPIQWRIEGDMTGIQNALALLATQSPVIGLDNWTIQTVGAVRPASNQRLGAQFNFFVLRSRP